MSEFKKVTMEDGDLIRKYLLDKDNLCCEFSFGNSVLWDYDRKLEYCILGDVLIYRMVYDEIMYCTPNFKGQAGAVLDFIDADAGDRPYKITCLSEDMKEEVLAARPDRYKFSTDRGHSDYIYLVENLAYLKGKKYHKKKNHLNSFLKNNEFEYEPISANNVVECIDMKNRWLAAREVMSPSLGVESAAIEYALNNFEKFGFVGGLIRIGGVVKAFTLGERLSEDTFVTHFEKAEDDIRGLYTIINQQFAEKTLLGNFTYVNREEDMGIEGLRQAKMTYNPEMIYDKYVASRKAV